PQLKNNEAITVTAPDTGKLHGKKVIFINAPLEKTSSGSVIYSDPEETCKAVLNEFTKLIGNGKGTIAIPYNIDLQLAEDLTKKFPNINIQVVCYTDEFFNKYESLVISQFRRTIEEHIKSEITSKYYKNISQCREFSDYLDDKDIKELMSNNEMIPDELID